MDLVEHQEAAISCGPITESLPFERKHLYTKDQKPIKYFHNARGNPPRLELNVELISEESERKEMDSQPNEPVAESLSNTRQDNMLSVNISEEQPSNPKTESLDYSFSEDPSNLTYRISDSASGFNNSLADRLPKFSTASLTLSDSSSMQPPNDFNFRSSLIEYRESMGQDSNPFEIMITEEQESYDKAGPIRIDTTTPIDSPKEAGFGIQQIKDQLNMQDIKFNFDTEEISGESLSDSDYVQAEESLDKSEMIVQRYIESSESVEHSKSQGFSIDNQGRSCSCSLCPIF